MAAGADFTLRCSKSEQSARKSFNLPSRRSNLVRWLYALPFDVHNTRGVLSQNVSSHAFHGNVSCMYAMGFGGSTHHKLSTLCDTPSIR